MRIFALGPGRSGSLTFAKAAAHLEGFTAGHETGCKGIGDLFYPDNHIESDTHLVWVLPALMQKYPDAWYVILHRNREDSVNSIANRRGAIAFRQIAFAGGGSREDAARSYYDFVHEYLNRALPFSRTMTFPLEAGGDGFRTFCEYFHLPQGGVSDGALEYATRYNATEEKEHERPNPNPGTCPTEPGDPD